MTIRVLRTVSELRAWRATAGTLGMVPTMGALHEGHLSLVRHAIRDGHRALVSIFVNPAQFAPNEDYSAYPRRETQDLGLLEHAGAHAAFVPQVEEIYPDGDDTRVVPGAIAAPLEGRIRREHFAGVATIVTKLLALARPDAAYFGQKDFQQLRVVQRVARDLALGPRIVGCPTVRDPAGLALSSRNAYLAPDERERALNLSAGLFAARERWQAGERSPERLRETVQARARLAGPLDYVSVADPFTLAELERPSERAVISLAARVGRARLIDNVLLGIELAELEAS